MRIKDIAILISLAATVFCAVLWYDAHKRTVCMRAVATDITHVPAYCYESK